MANWLLMPRVIILTVTLRQVFHFNITDVAVGLCQPTIKTHDFKSA
jgi:hypothetical protein